MRDPYELLGVPYDVDELALKKRFHELAKKHHPDAGGDAETFKLIAQAHDQIASNLANGTAFEPELDDVPSDEASEEEVYNPTDYGWEAYPNSPAPDRDQEVQEAHPKRTGWSILQRMLFVGAAAAAFVAAIVINASNFPAPSRRQEVASLEHPVQTRMKYVDTQPDVHLDGARANYLAAVFAQLRSKRYFPQGTPSGDLVLRFVISSSGAVTSREILRSSGSKALDNAVVSTVDRASPFPSFPSEIKAAQMSITIPVNVKGGLPVHSN